MSRRRDITTDNSASDSDSDESNESENPIVESSANLPDDGTKKVEGNPTVLARRRKGKHANTDPCSVPTQGKFYLHDSREEEKMSTKEKPGYKQHPKSKRIDPDSIDRWRHDKFEDIQKDSNTVDNSSIRAPIGNEKSDSLQKKERRSQKPRVPRTTAVDERKEGNQDITSAKADAPAKSESKGIRADDQKKIAVTVKEAESITSSHDPQKTTASPISKKPLSVFSPSFVPSAPVDKFESPQGIGHAGGVPLRNAGKGHQRKSNDHGGKRRQDAKSSYSSYGASGHQHTGFHTPNTKSVLDANAQEYKPKTSKDEK